MNKLKLQEKLASIEQSFNVSQEKIKDRNTQIENLNTENLKDKEESLRLAGEFRVITELITEIKQEEVEHEKLVEVFEKEVHQLKKPDLNKKETK